MNHFEKRMKFMNLPPHKNAYKLKFLIYILKRFLPKAHDPQVRNSYFKAEEHRIRLAQVATVHLHFIATVVK